MNASLIMKCDGCGMPLAEGPLYTDGEKQYCENCLPKDEFNECDFCGEPEPHWLFRSTPHAPLSTAEVGDEIILLIDMSSDWLSCDTCKTYVDADQPTDLGERVVAMRGLPKGFDNKQALDEFRQVVNSYFTVLLDMLVRPAEPFLL